MEDDEEIREGIETFLKEQGYKVFQAADMDEDLFKVRIVWKKGRVSEMETKKE